MQFNEERSLKDVIDCKSGEMVDGALERQGRLMV